MKLPLTAARVVRCVLLCLAICLAVPKVSAEDIDKTRYDLAMKQLGEANDEYHRWVTLGSAAKESLNQGHDAEAKKYAEELEKLTPKYLKDWNYGNAVHDSNVVLGRLALKNGDLDTAKGCLLVAGHSPGSPQMGSFGPNMSLARDLLLKGEKTVVLEYLDLCRAFWKMERGRLDLWRKDIESGDMPDFGANLIY